MQWLGKQLDEDELIAEEAAERSPEWKLAMPLDDAELGDASWLNLSERKHAERHDPARVLREIDAKRQLLDLHAPGEMEYVDGDVCMACDVRGGEPFYPCKTLRLLALACADRPGYRAEWRP